MKNLNVYILLGFPIILLICTIINSMLGAGFLIGAIFGFIMTISILVSQYTKDKNTVISFLDECDDLINN